MLSGVVFIVSGLDTWWKRLHKLYMGIKSSYPPRCWLVFICSHNYFILHWKLVHDQMTYQG